MPETLRSKQPGEKVILHIENNVEDRDSVKKLFSDSPWRIVHYSSIDMEVNEDTIPEYLAYIKKHSHMIDFIILDLGLSTRQEDEMQAWYVGKAKVYPPAWLKGKIAGVCLLDRIIEAKALGNDTAEKIVIYTQFDPKGDFVKDISMLFNDWRHVVIPAYYKGESTDATALRIEVENRLGIVKKSIYYYSADTHIMNSLKRAVEDWNKIEEASRNGVAGDALGIGNLEQNESGSLEALEAIVTPEADTRVLFILDGHAVDDFENAVSNFRVLYERYHFGAAVIDLVGTPEDEKTFKEINDHSYYNDRTIPAKLNAFSTILLIREIEKVSKGNTKIIALTKGNPKPALVRSLMKTPNPRNKTLDGPGVDWVVDKENLHINVQSSLWGLMLQSVISPVREDQNAPK